MDSMLPALLFIGLVVLVVALWRPFYGLLILVVVNQFDAYVGLVGSVSLGRIVGAVTLFAWGFRVYRRRHSRALQQPRLNLLLLAFALITMLSATGSAHPEASLAPSIKIWMLLAMAVFVQDLVETWDEVKKLVWVVAVAYGASGLVGLYQYYTLSQGIEAIGTVYQRGEAMRLGGIRDNPNEYGMLLMSGIPFLYYVIEKAKSQRARIVYVGILAVAIFSLFLTVSRTHIFGLITFNLVYLWYKLQTRRTRVAGLVLASLGVGIALLYLTTLPPYVLDRIMGISPEDDRSSFSRLVLFEKGVSLVLEAPIFGVGPGNGRFFGPLLGMQFHDVFSATMGELGLAGLLVLVLICVHVVAAQRRMLQSPRWPWTGDVRDLITVIHAAFIAFLVSGFGNVIFNQRLFWMYIALTAVIYRAGRTRVPVRAPEMAAPPRRGALVAAGG